MSVFNPTQTLDHTKQKMFFGEPVNVARYDRLKYPFFDTLVQKQLGFFWRPEEVNCVKDGRDFKALTPHEQHIFTANLKRQILLDSVQGRSPTIAFLPIVSLPEVENWIQTWAFSETIHSRSYTHIIRNIYPDPSVVFDEMLAIPEILECGADVSRYYDALIAQTNLYQISHFDVVTERKLMRDLWMCLMSVNILEGIRFYVSFACSWAFAETKKMEGNAKIIKLIARDEALHLVSTQQMIKLLLQETSEYESIRDEMMPHVLKLFDDAIEQEVKWADYLFKDGSMIGLNKALLTDYIHWIGKRRKQAVGVPFQGPIGANPLPWTERWIGGREVQVAPQETQVQSYIVGGVTNDVDDHTFKGFKL